MSNVREGLAAAIRADDACAVRKALSDGANPCTLHEGETALHTAVRYAGTGVVEALIEGGALEWVVDSEGRTPLAVARAGDRANRDALVALLDRTIIADASFRKAVDAVHAGDITTLRRLLDAEPRLLRERTRGPAVYHRRARGDYFRDPKLFWFVANNPTTVDVMPRNIVAVANEMIARGVEADDLDYTLELLMTSGKALEQGHLRPLMRALLDAGAKPSVDAIVVTAAHGMLDPLHVLIESGHIPGSAMAATFGNAAQLQKLLSDAASEEIATAFGLAVINRHIDAARVALDAGADIDAFLPVHSHGTALHQAAASDDAEMIAFLLQRGARTDIRDTLWDGTALGWATFANHAAAKAALEQTAGLPGDAPKPRA